MPEPPVIVTAPLHAPMRTRPRRTAARTVTAMLVSGIACSAVATWLVVTHGSNGLLGDTFGGLIAGAGVLCCAATVATTCIAWRRGSWWIAYAWLSLIVTLIAIWPVTLILLFFVVGGP